MYDDTVEKIIDGEEFVKACPICGMTVLHHCWHDGLEEVGSEWMPKAQATQLEQDKHDEQIEIVLSYMKSLTQEELSTLIYENFCAVCFDKNPNCKCAPGYDI